MAAGRSGHGHRKAVKALKIIRNVLLALVGLVLVLLIAFQVVMRPSVLTGIVNRIAADYVEGSVNFKEVKAHVIKSFPYLHLEASDFSITYPHSRYAQFDSLYPDPGRRFSLMKAGREIPGEAGQDGTDTLASFRNLDVSLNYMAFVRGGEIHVHKVKLTHPRIFAHYFSPTAANWDILPIGGDTSKKESKPLPAIKVNQVRFTDRPFIVFTDPVDTLHGMFTLRNLELDGKISTEDLTTADISLRIDSLFASGRLPADTLALRLESLRTHISERRVRLEAKAAARLRTGRLGRLSLPIHINADVLVPETPEGEWGADVQALTLGVSALELEGAGTLWKKADGTLDMDVSASVEDCPLGSLIDEFKPNIEALRKIGTDARLSLTASAKGAYGNGQTPIVNAHIQIPQARLNYEGLGRQGKIALDGIVSTDEDQVVNAHIKKLLVDILGAKLNLKGGVEDALGKDPLISVSGTARARVDSLTRAFSAQRGIRGTGTVDAALRGRARLSQLNMARIGNASINCDLTAHNLTVEDTPDALSAFLPQLKANLSTQGNQIDGSIRKGARILALKADIDTVNFQYKDMFVRGRSLKLMAQNSAEILRGGKNLTPLMGVLRVGGLRLKDEDGVSLALRGNTETFRIEPATSTRPTPRLTLTSESGGLRVRQGANMYAFRNLKFDLAGSRRAPRQNSSARRNHILDSLQRVYPGVERDSLFAAARRSRLRVQDDFASSDIHVSLGSSLKQYVREWDMEGKLNLKEGTLVMPSFPLPTSLSAVNGSFTNDQLNLGNITVKAGESDLSAQASLTGLRRLLIGRGRSQLKLKADVQSNYIDANELMRAYAYYSTYEPPKDLSDASESDVQEAVSGARLPDSTSTKLIVIPSNLEVDFSLEASGIKYDSLRVSWAAADVAMKDRTIQVTNALAASNMGDIYFEGFYSTRSKEDLKAGFDLNLVNITAEKVITLFPAVDTLMPMLTSFAGELDCELAATTDIDTTMNLVLPSIDGIMKISGKDLQLKDSKEFTKIASMLLFRDKKKAHIDNMSVTGIVQDNVLEVFPFVLKIDRYLVAASGTQSLSKDFSYHISVIKSPLLLKFGLNAWGPDFDNIHYGLAAAKYRSANVPVYTKQLDTVQYNLIAAIHNIFELGVEKAMAENRARGYQIASGSAPQDSAPPDIGKLEEMESKMEGIEDEALSGREALKAEILELEKKAAQNR